ncbi:Aminomethyltransferase folate-binding domain family protein [Babesia bovis T2Bo]|uniref:Uncharacterized protein n=1 Tax=Babesia bovis TaxID=5865 RepID=A7AW21_BABBO|nr:Aminomethyltransferase folate-binding domain family protein [Babesia bovis T2Bo]EDO05249.1 Aminomethyltransferase folate-binding domain family protein [Babesia bovis T2Bo]|eukprot:XP_001608817.1 hypothetical protein [Babesia bovis T2Bo]
MNMICGRLRNRGLLTLSGKDSLSFLQGLTSTDVSSLTKNIKKIFPTLFLGSDGRILSDGLLSRDGERILLETASGNIPTLSNLIARRKVSAKVDYSIEKNYSVNAYIPKELLHLIRNGPQGDTVSNTSLQPPDYECDMPILARKYIAYDATNQYRDITEPYRLYLTLNGFALPLPKEVKTLKLLPQDMFLHRMGLVAQNKGCYVGQEIMNRVMIGTLTHKYHMNFVIRRDHFENCRIAQKIPSFLETTKLYRILAEKYGAHDAHSIMCQILNEVTEETPNEEVQSKHPVVIYYTNGLGLVLIPRRGSEGNAVLINGQDHKAFPL